MLAELQVKKRAADASPRRRVADPPVIVIGDDISRVSAAAVFIRARARGGGVPFALRYPTEPFEHALKYSFANLLNLSVLGHLWIIPQGG